MSRTARAASRTKPLKYGEYQPPALEGWQDSIVEQVKKRFGIKEFKFSAARRPTDTKRLSRAMWPPLTVVAVVIAFVVESRKVTYSTGSNVALAVGFAFILAGGVVDRRRRYEERSGRARLAGFALLGVGLFVALAVLASASSGSMG